MNNKSHKNRLKIEKKSIRINPNLQYGKSRKQRCTSRRFGRFHGIIRDKLSENSLDSISVEIECPTKNEYQDKHPTQAFYLSGKPKQPTKGTNVPKAIPKKKNKGKTKKYQTSTR